MKRVYYVWLFLLLAGLASCAKNDARSSLEGRIDVRVNADQSLTDEMSRAAEEESVPDINDFALAIESVDGKVSNSWESFADFSPISVAVGTYTVTASYGDAEAEGFDAVSYLGSTNVEVRSAETSEASVTCVINKAKVSIAYTDEFKSYFNSYSAYVSSSKGNKVTYSADEVRGAYFVPGDLGVYLEVTRQGVSKKVTLNPKNFTAEEKHEYRLTMDVDAAAASLKIIFNDNPSSEQNVEINISDEALNADPPVFTPYGFTSGNTLEVLEGAAFTEKLEAYLNAPAGLAKCELVTNSAFLKEQGWPESVDLMNLTTEQSQKMTALGLQTKGLGVNHDKIALIDFQQLVPNLTCTSENNEVHTFTLRATDALTKVSEELKLVIETRNNGFAVELPETVPYASTSVTFTLTLEGDVSKVKFYYDLSDTGVYQPFDAEKVQITSDNTKHTVTLTYPESLTDTEHDVKLKAEFGVKVIEKSFKIEDPELTLSLKNGDADVWAKHADFQVIASPKSRSSRTISTSTIELQYEESENVWKKWDNMKFDGVNGFTVNGLTSNTSYKFRAVYCQDVYSNEMTIKTEEELTIPNGGMEDWFSNKVTEDGVDLSGNDLVYWVKWYPWSESEDASKGWNTLNQTTTQYGAKPSSFLGLPTSPYVGCCYTTNSGTVRTEDKQSGSYAALIRTVGWGRGNTAAVLSGNMGTCENVTPGELYLGMYNVENHKPEYGYAFSSRPMAVQFMYKYSPKNSADWFVVTVEVKDDTGSVIAAKTVTKTGTVDTYTQEIIKLEYEVLKKAAVLSIVFKSSGNESCWEANTDNLTPPPGSNLSGGEYLGSQLYIDDVELIYE